METDPEQINRLLDYLLRSRGFDFSGYKSPGLMRRIAKRMQEIDIADLDAYIDRLEVDADEFSTLFNAVLINVTSFFRDGTVWEQLSTQLRGLLSSPRPAVRVWCAGCASGQEAYSIGIVLAELLGLETFCRTVKIYATDIDEEALNQARFGSYSAREVSSVPPALLERYFERVNQRYVVQKDIRKALIFGRHNLLQDAPISRVDLLSCRNTMMYFNAETQAQTLGRFHFALRDDTSILFLGKAEMLVTHSQLFTPIDLKRRIFSKLSRRRPPGARTALLAQGTEESDPRPSLDLRLRLREAMVELSPQAQIALNTHHQLVLTNERASHLFGLSSHDLGRSFRDLAMAQHNKLRANIEHALVERRSLVSTDFTWLTGSTTLHFDVQTVPLVDGEGQLLGVQLTFVDVTDQHRLQLQFQQVNRELEATSEELQSASEELETTNEELQSTNEELETTNEELQSTNEELETMNEELQSTNEELQTTNEELRQRSEELNQVNSFLSSILSSLRMGVAVLDSEQRVRIWNHRAEDLWGLRQEEVLGRCFLDLDIGLPVDQLRSRLRASGSGEKVHEEVVLPALNRRGKQIACKVTCTPLWPHGPSHRGTMLLMEDVSPSSEPT